MSGGKIANTMPAEPTTGATDEQLIQAFVRLAGPEHDPTYDPQSDWFCQDELRRYARDLVPPDHRLIGPEQLAAIGRATTLANAAAEWREAEADEWGSPGAESRKTGAICDLIDAIDAITDADLTLLTALMDGTS